MTPAMNSTRRLSARAVALIGTGAVVAYALLAAVQILVWNPQAAVPGVGLDQIYADVAATGESMAAGMVIAFLAVGPLLAIALLGRVSLPCRGFSGRVRSRESDAGVDR